MLLQHVAAAHAQRLRLRRNLHTLPSDYAAFAVPDSNHVQDRLVSVPVSVVQRASSHTHVAVCATHTHTERERDSVTVTCIPYAKKSRSCQITKRALVRDSCVPRALPLRVTSRRHRHCGCRCRIRNMSLKRTRRAYVQLVM